MHTHPLADALVAVGGQLVITLTHMQACADARRPRHAPPLEHALACLLTDLLGPVWVRSPGDADAAARVLDDVAQTIERELHLVPFDPPPAPSRTSRRRPGCR